MYFRDSLNGLGIPGNIWFHRFAVTYVLQLHWAVYFMFGAATAIADTVDTYLCGYISIFSH